MEYFKFLPEEIRIDILSRLPAEYVFRCKLVSTNWRLLVRHPSFYQMYLHHLYHPYDSPTAAAHSGKMNFIAFTDTEWKHTSKYHYIEYDNESTPPIQRITRINLGLPFKHFWFVGSCNGLICVVNRSVCICNPVTKEFVLLPKIERDGGGSRDPYTCGMTTSFGYASSTDEYKVVGICVAKKDSLQIYIYTLGSGSGWRDLGNFTNEFSMCDWKEAGVFANGVLYWMGVNFEKIITFDLAEEIFCEDISPPPFPLAGNWRDNKIGVVDGFFYIAIYLGVAEDGCFDIWLLKKKNDNHDMEERVAANHVLVWCRKFRVDNNRLLAITKTDGVLTYGSFYFNIYDTKTSTLKRLVEFKDWFRKVSPHKNTLVSLKELGEEYTELEESAKVEETSGCEQLQEDADPEYIYL